MILSRYLQCEPVEVSLETGAYGKPRISGVTTDIFFNISRSDRDGCHCGVKGSRRGVDIECADSCHPDVVEIAGILPLDRGVRHRSIGSGCRTKEDLPSLLDQEGSGVEGLRARVQCATGAVQC